jgi:mannan endo-1,4-beta-mannosidase
MKGNWFWWGERKGDTGSPALYRQLFSRFVNHHEPENLIWLWNVDSSDAPPNGPERFAGFFPGLQCADVLSIDNYGEFEASYYDDPLALAAGKPMARWPGDQRPSPGPAADRSRERQ